MGERKHKVEDGEKKAKVKPGIKTSPQVTHPILQLQQMVGNKAVTNMIQRHRLRNIKLNLSDSPRTGLTLDSGFTHYDPRLEEAQEEEAPRSRSLRE